MKYIVYLTTNLKSNINGINRIYIGVHLTNNPNIFDGYLGDGVYINLPSSYMYPKTPFLYAVKKYGTNAFYRNILFIYDTKEEAYQKEAELIDNNFVKLEHTYNAYLGGKSFYEYKPIYQFDLLGNLIKEWDFKEVCKFYNRPKKKFEYAIQNKHPLMDSFWSFNKNINISEYSTKSWGEPEVTHLYSKNGKWLGEFISRKECSKFINVSELDILKAIKHQTLLLGQYYVSNKLMDEFKPKARKLYIDATFYVYQEDGLYLGKYIGKLLMKVINNHSWASIRDIIQYKNGWYKNFYISEVKVDKIPKRSDRTRFKVDIYDKFGTFIETSTSSKDVRLKYNVPSAKIKNIQLGDKYYGNYIFKYHSK